MRLFRTVTLSAIVSLSLSVACGGEGAPSTKGKTRAARDHKETSKKGKDKKGGADEDAKADAGGDADKPATKATANPDAVLAALEAFGEGDLDKVLSHFAKDVVWDAVGSPVPASKGKPALEERWGELLTGFPDMKVKATRIMNLGEAVVLQGVLTGTNNGEFRGAKASKKKAGAELLMWIKQNEDGKINDVKIVWNEAAIMTQIGAMPSGGGMPKPKVPALPDGEVEKIEGPSEAKNIELVKASYADFGPDYMAKCEEKYCAEGFIHHDVSMGTTQKTPEEHKKALDEIFKAFPDMKFELETVLASGDWVVTFGTGKGTHKGDFGPIKATNKEISMSYSEVMRMEGGKVKETWGYGNPMEMIQQLGMLPKPDAVAKK